MAENSKYFYMRLKEDFFESEEMVLLEALQDGMLYQNILLKLYCRSLKSEGRLMFNNVIPYNAEMIAKLTRHQVGTVEKALEIFKQMGLIEILDNGAIYMLNIQSYIGKSSSEADRQRQYQHKIEAEKETCKESNKISCKKSNKISCKKSTPYIEIDKDIDNIKAKDTDTDTDTENSTPNKKTKKGFDAVVEEYTTNEELKAAIFDFIQFRKAIKAPLTDRALTLCLNKLDKLANNDLEKIAVLNQSIERGWKGLFEVKDNSFNATAPKSNNTVPTEDEYDFERGSFWK